MPTYEYECSKCGHHFDAFQSMSADRYETCPKELCQMKKWGKGKVKRLLGAGAGLLFKGSGFYITDYRSEGYKSSKEKDSAAAPPAKPAESKSTDKAKSSASSSKEKKATSTKAK